MISRDVPERLPVTAVSAGVHRSLYNAQLKSFKCVWMLSTPRAVTKALVNAAVEFLLHATVKHVIVYTT